MSKRQLIEEIRRYNPTASPQFLDQFDEDALKQYLRHLEGARNHEKEICSWARKRPHPRIAI